ncbi:MAG: TRAP transporter small permease subunit [Alphaproteobacteria bacterium]|nr:TRAP transporter small permease subunit [Alphaproteobacteria bacterium]
MRLLRRLTHHVMAFLMAVIFVTFMVQVAMRYLAKFELVTPFIWTQDMTSSAFLWVILFGGGVALAQADQVKFDTVYNMFGPGARRIMAILASLAIVGLFIYSLPAVWDYLSILSRFGKPNPTLKYPFTDGKPVLVAHIYGIYLVFAAGVIIRYAMRAARLMMGATPERLDSPADRPRDDRA